MIDEEIRKLTEEAAKRAELVLKANKSSLEKLAKALLEKETLEEKELVEALKGTVLPETAKLH